ncbi:MAG TPA: SGNH/GDSL hydrolase family protein [Anaerolineales bacterium]
MRRFYNSAAIAVLNTLLLLVVIELISGGIVKIVDRPASKKLIARITGRPNDMIVYYQELSYYQEQDWGPLYWKEFKRALRTTYSPYVVWRSAPFDGTMINIDLSGYRHTPGAECGANAYKVYVFGGSAIWGWGSPDQNTIPALLESELQSKLGTPVCVMNYGENAYVSTQGVIHLMLLLESGQIPDVVIFYDGVNDVLAASQSGTPIVHQNLSEISDLFEDHQAPIMSFIQSSNSYQLLQMMLSQIPISAERQAPKLQYDPELLSDQVAEAYLNNYGIVSSLADTYHFDFYFFWQPHILIGNKHLSSEEQNMITGLNWVLNLDPPLVELFQNTYKKIEAETPEHEHLYYLGNIFDPVEESVWIDTWGHTTPKGNQIVTNDLIRVIKH